MLRIYYGNEKIPRRGNSPRGICRIHLVEMRRIELLSEDNVTWASPSAVCAFI